MPRSRKKWISMLVLMCFVGYGLWWVIDSLGGPVSGEVKQVETKFSLENPDVPEAIKEFRGENIAFFLPESYEEKRHDISSDASLPTLEQLFFTQMKGPGRKLAVTIERNRGEPVENLSSYLFRMGNPKIYRKDSLQWNEKNIPLFLKSDPVYEVVGYIEERNLVATLSLSSASEIPEKLMPDFLEILKGMRWDVVSPSNEK